MRFTLIFAGTVLALFLLEGVLRLTYVSVKMYPYEKDAVIPDSQLGHRLRPNQHTVMSNGVYSAALETNTDGYRDIASEKLPWKGVIAIGDSQTFGQGVQAKDTWPEILQEKLQTNIYNSAVFGYGATHYRPVLEELSRKGFDHKTVLYAMSWNDIFSGSVPADITTVIEGVLAQNPKLAHVHANRPWLDTLKKSHVGNSLYNVSINLASLAGIQTSKSFDDSLIFETEATKKVLENLNEYITESGGKLVIVHVGDPNFVDPKAWENYRRRHFYSRHFAKEIFGPWAEKQGIGFEDAVDALYEKTRSGTPVVIPIDGHFNEVGHQIIADTFYRMTRIDRSPLER